MKRIKIKFPDSLIFNFNRVELWGDGRQYVLSDPYQVAIQVIVLNNIEHAPLQQQMHFNKLKVRMGVPDYYDQIITTYGVMGNIDGQIMAPFWSGYSPEQLIKEVVVGLEELHDITQSTRNLIYKPLTNSKISLS